MTLTVSHQPITTDVWVRPQARQCKICGGEVALDKYFSAYLGFPLSISFQQRSILIFSYVFLLQEGQRGQAWEHSTKATLSRKSGSIEYKGTFTHLIN
jgi:hypothetical protein